MQPCAVELGRANVRRLAQEDREFAEAAGPTTFHLHNVFIPTAKHKVRCAPMPGCMPRACMAEVDYNQIPTTMCDASV